MRSVLALASMLVLAGCLSGDDAAPGAADPGADAPQDETDVPSDEHGPSESGDEGAGAPKEEEEPAPEEDAGDADPEPQPRKHRTVEFDLILTPRSQGSSGTNLRNCVEIAGPVAIVGGSATASWSAVAPTGAELELVYVPAEGGAPAVRRTGASPVEVALTASDASGDPVLVLVQAPEASGGTTLQQDVRLVLALDYTGGEPSFAQKGCYVS